MSAFLQTQRPGIPKPSPSKRARKRRPSVTNSLNGDDPHTNNNNTGNDEEGSGGEENEQQSAKKKPGMKAPVVEVGGPVEYKYNAEIAQMVSPLCPPESQRLHIGVLIFRSLLGFNLIGLCVWRDSKPGDGDCQFDRRYGAKPDDRARKPPISFPLVSILAQT